MSAKDYIVYRHTCPNGKVYIGITKQNPSVRWRNGAGYPSNKRFTNAIQKYGWDNITHEILYTNLTADEAKKKEIELIELHKARDNRYGYNICAGGELSTLGVHWNLSEETKAKMRESAYWKTHKISEETKKKMSIAKKGKPARNRRRVICVETGRVFESIAEAAKNVGVCSGAVLNYLSGRSKIAGGHRWEYE